MWCTVYGNMCRLNNTDMCTKLHTHTHTHTHTDTHTHTHTHTPEATLWPRCSRHQRARGEPPAPTCGHIWSHWQLLTQINRCRHAGRGGVCVCVVVCVRV